MVIVQGADRDVHAAHANFFHGFPRNVVAVNDLKLGVSANAVT